MYDEFAASIEVNYKVARDSSLNGKSRKEMRLIEFEEVEMRSVMMGFDVTIT